VVNTESVLLWSRAVAVVPKSTVPEAATFVLHLTMTFPEAEVDVKNKVGAGAGTVAVAVLLGAETLPATSNAVTA
jgi:hypothetical protein